MAEVIISGFVYFGSFMLGIFTLFGYMIYRIMKNMTDKSNMTNAARLVSHVVLHPRDFGKMYYLSDEEAAAIEIADLANDRPKKLRRPFWYENLDELSEVVKTRPPIEAEMRNQLT